MRSRKGGREGGSRGNRRIGEGKMRERHTTVGLETVTAWSHITILLSMPRLLLLSH